MKTSTLRFALLGAITLVSFTSFAQQSKAQLLSKVQSEYGRNTQIQYAPDDPSTRSRLFNLQTGHAGAFYNCDGEEDKRNSPYICWKTGHGDRFHRTFWDVLNWKKDRSEIAQRICDGAGACCSGNQGCRSCQQSQAVEVMQPQATCGCSSCVAKGKAKAIKSMPLLAQRAIVPSTITAKSGLLSQTTAIPKATAQVRSSVRSVVEPRGIVEEAPCDCYACRMNRGGEAAKTQQAVAAPKTASLLDRARSSRKQR